MCEVVHVTKPHLQSCPVAASLNQLGDMWTLLIVREALRGARRFGEFQRGTGIARNLLADRLARMVADGILSTHDIGTRGVRHEYRLTAKGRALVPVVVAISQWGNAWIYGEGREPTRLVHRETGLPIEPLRPSDAEGQPCDWRDVLLAPGPGADDDLRARIEARSTARRADDA